MFYVPVKNLPPEVVHTLKNVGYNRTDISVVEQATVSMAAASGEGRRAFTALVNFDTETSKISWGSWGGPNIANPTNPVDLDTTQRPLPANGCVIHGSAGGNHPVYATIYVRHGMRQRLLPAPSPDLDETDRKILGIFATLKSSYRAEALAAFSDATSRVNRLVELQFLKRASNGATSITTTGKNNASKY